MNMQTAVTMAPIGVFHTDAREIPRHWSLSQVEGTIQIDQGLVEGLADIRPGQKIVVIFWFHKSPAFSVQYLRQTPPYRQERMGVFSICSPRRPNPIGLSVLTVMDIQGGTIRVMGIDMLDGTPILDIKPLIVEEKDCPGCPDQAS